MHPATKVGPWTVSHERIQHAVGQGSFHSAKLEVRAPDGATHRFDYVYDCGAVAHSDKSALRRSIDRLQLAPRAGSHGRGVIDALVLSHYDQDHIVGAKQLARRYCVRRVFLPYLWPDALMLVLASQADTWRAVQVRALHALATGASTAFFGTPTTMVMSGGAQDDGGRPAVDPIAPAGDTTARPQAERAMQESVDRGEGHQPPLVLGMVFGVAGAAPAAALTARDDVILRVPDGGVAATDWRLRFWNRGINPALLQQLRANLSACGFPLGALSSATGVEVLLTWLDGTGNRDRAVQAYRAAVNATSLAPAVAVSSKHVANYLSLGLYSGPANLVDASTTQYSVTWSVQDSQGKCQTLPQAPKVASTLHPRNLRLGWLGTGDAPLGQADIWLDFEARYVQQLQESITVQVPHHGAAPQNGPKFFHPGLLPVPGMNAVVSAGARNSYSHPHKSVLAAVLAQRGQLRSVTEACPPGFSEQMSFTV